jgi:hypothetical protein
MTIKPPLKNIPQGILYTENESKEKHEGTVTTKPQKDRQAIRE